MKRFALLVMLGACGGGGGGGDDDDAPDARVPIDGNEVDAFTENGETTFTATKSGNPLWETAGWQIASVTNFDASSQQLWSQHHYDATNNAFEPGTVHAAPYDTEPANRMAALGWDPGDRFAVADWTYPAGLFIVGVIQPSAGAPTGKTSDGDPLPMIPDGVHLNVDGDMYHGNTNVDPEFDSTYPYLSVLAPELDADGWSHMTLSFGEDTTYIPGVPGSYTFRVHVYEIDTPANGWTIELPFTVE